MESVQSYIRKIPDFPKQGIQFYDITPLLKNPLAFQSVIQQWKNHFSDKVIHKIASVESRGFIFGSVLAQEMNTGFVPIRKENKLPFRTVSQNFSLEYRSEEKIEMHTDAVFPGENVLIIDDVLATGGTARASCNLIEKAGANVFGLGFLIELAYLNGRQNISKYDVCSLLVFDNDKRVNGS
jgi:adenine phosphoribosyltransferase